MTSIKVPTPQFGQPVEDGSGVITSGWRNWFQAMFNRVGGTTDKVEQAYQLGVGAVPVARQVVAGAGLSGGGDLTVDIGIRFYSVITSVAGLPTTGIQPNANGLATNGRKPGEGAGAGTGCPVFWSNNAWYSWLNGAVVTA